jgi:phage tail sheath protein FI
MSEVSYPGVYVEEIATRGRAIEGVPTSLAVFIGRAAWGPVDGPATVHGADDFARRYGGPTAGFPMTRAVRDFFANGGASAVIVRLFAPGTGEKAGDGVARLAFAAPGKEAPLVLAAASPGAWGNRLGAAIDRDGINAWTPKQFEEYGLAAADLFNLELSLRDEDGAVIASERLLNLTVREGGGPARIDRVLAAQSLFARLDGALPAMPPDNGSAGPASGGDDGVALTSATYLGDPERKTGLHQLDQLDLFNLLCIPPDRPGGELDPAVRQAAARYCRERRAFFIADPPAAWAELARQGRWAEFDPTALGIEFDDAANAAIYFPRPLDGGEPAAPCGAVAGVYARTDANRGVWHAPAGVEAGIPGFDGLELELTDDSNGKLNPLGINCLRSFHDRGLVVWGARTLRGADSLNDDYKYVPVRRLMLYIEESLRRGTQWAVFEPNAEPLWAALRLQVGEFLHRLWVQGAIYDKFVTCDATTTTQADIDAGVVNIVVGFAPLKPAEFVILMIQQIAEPPAA